MDTATEFQRRVLGRIAIVGSGDLDIVDGCHACTTSRREDLMCGRFATHSVSSAVAMSTLS